MKRILIGGSIAITLLALVGAKPRVVAIEPPIPIARTVSSTESIPQKPLTNVEAYINAQCKKAGINPIDCLWIVSHESQNGINMRADDGICPDTKSVNYGKETFSRGFWMINSCYHPEVSDACADDLTCSTAWSIKNILAGHIDQWTTWRDRFELYPNQNPPQ